MSSEEFSPQTPSAQENSETLEQTWAQLPADTQNLVPAQNMGYYQRTNEMHCDTSKPGGSKFLEIANIFKVLEKDGGRIADMVKARVDDRQAYLDSGVDSRVFLPAVKSPTDPEKLPEALYYKVEGLKGKLGIVQLKQLDPDTDVIIRREKSIKDNQGKEKVPCSFSIIKESLDEMPDTDFATVIIGREGGAAGKDAVWTIHPGAPIRPTEGDFITGSESLPGPQEGIRQKVILVKVRDLLASGKITDDDYVKIIPGKTEEVLAQYEVTQKA